MKCQQGADGIPDAIFCRKTPVRRGMRARSFLRPSLGCCRQAVPTPCGKPAFGSVARFSCLRRPMSPCAAAAASPASEQLSAIDYLRVVIPTSLCLLLTNCNRIATSIAFIPMSAQFQWASGVQGLVSSSFLWGYMATQLLAGSLADKYGAKKVMAAGVIWMSVAGFILPLAVSSANPLPVLAGVDNAASHFRCTPQSVHTKGLP